MPNKPQDGTERRSLTSRIDRLRWSLSEQTIKNTISRYESICSMDSSDQIKQEIYKCFPENKHKVLRDFFVEHPVCWTDIQRKIHAFRKHDNEEMRWYIPDNKLWDIYASFLIRGRKKDIGQKIWNLLPHAISENQELIKFAGEQPSLLDDGWFMFSSIPAGKRKKLIKTVIKTGIMKNIDWCRTYEETNIYIPRILPKLLRYITEIFWKTIHLSHCKTIDDIAKELEKKFSSWHGSERENAFRVIQSFHAWASIEDIEKSHTNAQEKIQHVPRRLKEIGINIEGEIKIIEHNEATIYSAHIDFQWKKYRCEWRVKTIKSILQKMWETEEYTNKDAIRDMIWLYFIFPNDTPIEEKKKLIIKSGSLMPDFGYILKDKWWVWDDIHSIETALKTIWKSPVHVSFKLGDTSNPEINNTSMSGFISLWGESLWTEFQYSDEKWAEWKKRDDKVYKPKWMLSILMRWPKFATPHDCYELLNERIKARTLKELGHPDINSMILSYIVDEQYLIPYISDWAKELLITNKSKESAFNEKFPSMRRCLPWDSLFEKVKMNILGLS